MRLGWHVHLLGPFSVGGTIWRSKRRRRRAPARQVYHGTRDGRQCPHNHTREDTALTCANTWMRKYGG